MLCLAFVESWDDFSVGIAGIFRCFVVGVDVFGVLWYYSDVGVFLGCDLFAGVCGLLGVPFYFVPYWGFGVGAGTSWCLIFPFFGYR